MLEPSEQTTNLIRIVAHLSALEACYLFKRSLFAPISEVVFLVDVWAMRSLVARYVALMTYDLCLVLAIVSFDFCDFFGAYRVKETTGKKEKN